MADQSDNFWGGFILGSLIGGTVGALIASKLNEVSQEQQLTEAAIAPNQSAEQVPVDKARRSLEQKIAQLNSAIDAVSNELSASGVNRPGATNGTVGNGRKNPTPSLKLESNSDRETP